MVSSTHAISEESARPHEDMTPSVHSSESEHRTGSVQKDGHALTTESSYQQMSESSTTRASYPVETTHEAGFEAPDGDINGHGYNETDVDVVAIPCIGASSETWYRDPFDASVFEEKSSQATRGTSKEYQRRPKGAAMNENIKIRPSRYPASWIRQGIRQQTSIARIMLYRHRQLHDGFTLEDAANDLLQHLLRMRTGLDQSRPFFLICHSIGGLVAKLALIKAVQEEDYKPLLYACHGITFFATPHRGSSYMSMPKLRDSIRQLLYLEKPLPLSITEGLRLDNKHLLEIHDRFTDVVSEMRVWTCCETVDSQLSGLGATGHNEVHFSAPIVSIKSCLCESRGEQVYSLESNHALCASFGPGNVRIMHAYLQSLGDAICKAQILSKKYEHHPLDLNDKVKVELIGFYEDPDDTNDRDIRLYIAKHSLGHFLNIGPERCLKERLATVAARPQPIDIADQGRSSASQGNGFGPLDFINDGVQGLRQRVFGARGESQSRLATSEAALSESPSLVDHVPERIPKIVLNSQQSVDSDTTGRSISGPSQANFGPVELSERTDALRRDDNSLGRQQTSAPTGHSEDTARPPSSHEVPSEISRTGSPKTSPSEHNTSRTADLQEMTAGFSRPDPNKRRIMWLHLPFNNPYWVKLVFDKLAESHDRSYSWLLNNEHWAKRHVKDRHATQNTSYVRSGCAFAPAESHNAPARKRSDTSSNNKRSSGSIAVNPSSNLYVFLPYLNFDTYLNVIRRRRIVRRRIAQGRARPVPPDVAELTSLEARVIWDFIGNDPPLNTRRTLDQYGYPELQDTYARDDDQMLYKLTKERFAPSAVADRKFREEEESRTQPSLKTPPDSDSGLRRPSVARLAKNVIREGLSATSDDCGNDGIIPSDTEDDLLDGNILMVDQLWLWAIDASTLATFFPKRESYPSEGQIFQQADLRNSIYNELNGDLTGRCDNAMELAAFVVLHAVTVLIDRTSHPNLEVFRIFEEALAILNERLTSSLKRFRMQTFKGKIGEDPTSSDSETEAYDDRPESIKKRHRREMEQSERENRENTSALLELRDMGDELMILQKLFAEQTKVVETMSINYERPELLEMTSNGRRYLDEAKDRLDDYERITSELLIRIDTARKDYDKFQEMVQRKAQVDEVRWSRLQTELASSQNLSVIIFTTFTVIFLPLSFFTSLFGMNTAEWSPEEHYVSLKAIGAISLPASLFLIVLSLILAFSTRVQSWFKRMFQMITSAVKFILSMLAKLEPELLKTKRDGGKAEAARARREQRRQRERERGYDYWETINQTRPRRYEIPGTNLKTASERRMQHRGDTWSSFRT